MEEKLLITGGEPLFGTVVPQGSKNAALPIIFATVLTSGVSTLFGVPDIGDVRVAVALIRELGATAHLKDGVLTVNTEKLSYREPSEKLTSAIRASSYLLGASLARFGRAHLCAFGGCNFDNRPIDMHVAAALALGGRLDGEEILTDGLVGGKITFEKRSVGATVNALLMASCAAGKTEIYGAAEEPHIKSLIDYLVAAGADIRCKEGIITVIGAPLHGASVKIIPDMIEAGSYLMLAPLTGGEIGVKCRMSSELLPLRDMLTSAGCELFEKDGAVICRGRIKSPLTLTTAPYPAYPTDLQPQAAPLMAAGYGGVITETVWRGRFGYLSELRRFGILSSTSPSMAYLFKSQIHPSSAECCDLRGGFALIMAALKAGGTSEIKKPETVFRGYENLTEKLSALGAKIAKYKLRST